jgi:hypothetical protein
MMLARLMLARRASDSRQNQYQRQSVVDSKSHGGPETRPRLNFQSELMARKKDDAGYGVRSISSVDDLTWRLNGLSHGSP